MVCFFVAGTRTRQENGATRIIPGSHLWDYSIPPPAADDTTIRCAELEPGDAFMMLGGCYHGAGANVTKDEERLVYGESGGGRGVGKCRRLADNSKLLSRPEDI